MLFSLFALSKDVLNYRWHCTRVFGDNQGKKEEKVAIYAATQDAGKKGKKTPQINSRANH